MGAFIIKDFIQNQGEMFNMNYETCRGKLEIKQNTFVTWQPDDSDGNDDDVDEHVGCGVVGLIYDHRKFSVPVGAWYQVHCGTTTII